MPTERGCSVSVRLAAAPHWAAAIKFRAGLFTLLMVLPFALGGVPNAPAADRETTEAEALIQSDHWKRARALLAPRAEAHPQNARDCFLLAEVKMAFKRFSEALPLAQQAVNLDGSVSEYHLKLGQVYGQLAAQAGVWSAGPLAVKFRKQVELAIKLGPENLEALESLMLFKYRAPRLMGGDKDEAHALAEKITALNPSQGYLAQAELAELDNNAILVEAYDRKAAQADPRNYDAQTALAKFESQSSHPRYDEARKHAEDAVQLDPKRLEAYAILARVFAMQSRWRELDQILAAAERNVPDDLSPFYAAAQALLETDKELARAEGYARKYLSQEPEGEEPGAAEANQLLGQIIARQGRHAEAPGDAHRAAG